MRNQFIADWKSIIIGNSLQAPFEKIALFRMQIFITVNWVWRIFWRHVNKYFYSWSICYIQKIFYCAMLLICWCVLTAKFSRI